MSSLSPRNRRTYSMGGGDGHRAVAADTRWSDIDKTRLYSIGTVMYSALTVALHPLTVAKIRRQVSKGASASAGGPAPLPGPAWNNLGQYYRGLGVVVSLAIPARIIYISTLEYSRELVDATARRLLSDPPPSLAACCGMDTARGLLPLVTPLSGGVAGGLAAVSSQLVVVPMDVVSQRIMVMDDHVYRERGSALRVARSIAEAEGWRGLYRGFGLSLLTSLPAGSVWWATYAWCKDRLGAEGEKGGLRHLPPGARQGVAQVASALGAAVTASILTQPLDTIKTRLQVGNRGVAGRGGSTLLSILSEVKAMRGLYKGLLPRIAHMGIWGSVLSSAYEVLKLVSRKDYKL